VGNKENRGIAIANRATRKKIVYLHKDRKGLAGKGR
jgi:hypothetical protein